MAAVPLSASMGFNSTNSSSTNDNSTIATTTTPSNDNNSTDTSSSSSSCQDATAAFALYNLVITADLAVLLLRGCWFHFGKWSSRRPRGSVSIYWAVVYCWAGALLDFTIGALLLTRLHPSCPEHCEEVCAEEQQDFLYESIVLLCGGYWAWKGWSLMRTTEGGGGDGSTHHHKYAPVAATDYDQGHLELNTMASMDKGIVVAEDPLRSMT